MSEIRSAIAESILARAILEIAAGKGLQLREHDNLIALASITNRVAAHEIAAQLQDSTYKNLVRSVLFDKEAEGL